MRYVLVGMLSVAALKCREIQPLTPVVTVHGYQINGTVSTPNGVPLAGVEVILYYNYVFADPSPADTQAVVLVELEQNKRKPKSECTAD